MRFMHQSKLTELYVNCTLTKHEKSLHAIKTIFYKTTCVNYGTTTSVYYRMRFMHQSKQTEL